MQRPELSRYHFPLDEVHTKLTTLILTYFLFDLFDGLFRQSIENLLSYSGSLKPETTSRLFDYICRHWYTHVLYAKESNDIYELLTTLLEKRHELLEIVQRVMWQKYPVITTTGVEGLARLLRLAVVVGNPWIVARIVEHSPDLIDFKIGEFDTPLILAVENGHLDVINLLLDRGADVNFATEGLTPLIASLVPDREEILKLLLKRGADVNGHSLFTRRTTLHSAAEFGHLNLATVLLCHGADSNARSCGGQTPLHIAISNRYLEIVQELVKAGSDLTMKDDNGETPIHFALDCNLPRFARLDTSQREELAKRTVEILLSHRACLSDIGPISKHRIQWAISELWYPNLILSDDN